MAIKVGIIGLGTIGGGTIKVLEAKKSDFLKNLGVDLEVTVVCDIREEVLGRYAEAGYQTTTNVADVTQSDNVDILVELAGGYDQPKAWLTEAFQNKKHVVTANKALIAKYGADLFPIAAENRCSFLFEAAVGGGIPVIRSLQESLVGNSYRSINGIINGTCNYILSEMTENGGQFGDVLAEAQQKGFAEADPTFDVDGIDAAHKLAILATLCSKSFVDFEKIHVSGIREVEPIDIELASEMGYCIKLLGIVNNGDKGVDARVHPCLVEGSHLLAGVNGVLNAVYLKTDNLGPALLTGAGAGELPTASAVVGDIVDIARHLTIGEQMPIAMGYFNRDNPAALVPIDDIVTPYYVRFTTKDQIGVLAAITTALSNNNISVESIVQKPVKSADSATILVITHASKEADVNRALAEIADLDIELEPSKKIRFVS